MTGVPLADEDHGGSSGNELDQRDRKQKRRERNKEKRRRNQRTTESCKHGGRKPTLGADIRVSDDDLYPVPQFSGQLPLLLPPSSLWSSLPPCPLVTADLELLFLANNQTRDQPAGQGRKQSVAVGHCKHRTLTVLDPKRLERESIPVKRTLQNISFQHQNNIFF